VKSEFLRHRRFNRSVNLDGADRKRFARTAKRLSGGNGNRHRNHNTVRQQQKPSCSRIWQGTGYVSTANIVNNNVDYSKIAQR
jgi:hypothetical protein